MNEQPPLVWYQLVRENGDKMGQVTSIDIPTNAIIDKLKKLVKQENPDLKDIPPRCLIVYRNKTAYESKESHLEEDAAVSGLGDSKMNALVVVCPNPKSNGINVGADGRKKRFGRFTTCQETKTGSTPIIQCC
jgi:hypothetical protein